MYIYINEYLNIVQDSKVNIFTYNITYVLYNAHIYGHLQRWNPSYLAKTENINRHAQPKTEDFSLAAFEMFILLVFTHVAVIDNMFRERTSEVKHLPKLCVCSSKGLRGW